MIVVMVILVALLSAGAIALYLQVAETRSASLIKQSRESLFCAEAGLAVGREMLGEHGTHVLGCHFLNATPVALEPVLGEVLRKVEHGP